MKKLVVGVTLFSVLSLWIDHSFSTSHHITRCPPQRAVLSCLKIFVTSHYSVVAASRTDGLPVKYCLWVLVAVDSYASSLSKPGIVKIGSWCFGISGMHTDSHKHASACTDTP